jgi:hypothetical protein
MRSRHRRHSPVVASLTVKIGHSPEPRGRHDGDDSMTTTGPRVESGCSVARQTRAPLQCCYRAPWALPLVAGGGSAASALEPGSERAEGRERRRRSDPRAHACSQSPPALPGSCSSVHRSRSSARRGSLSRSVAARFNASHTSAAIRRWRGRGT